MVYVVFQDIDDLRSSLQEAFHPSSTGLPPLPPERGVPNYSAAEYARHPAHNYYEVTPNPGACDVTYARRRWGLTAYNLHDVHSHVVNNLSTLFVSRIGAVNIWIFAVPYLHSYMV